jgi:hypothetical protein
LIRTGITSTALATIGSFRCEVRTNTMWCSGSNSEYQVGFPDSAGLVQVAGTWKS